MDFKIIGIHNTHTRHYTKDIKIIRRNSKGFRRMKNEKIINLYLYLLYIIRYSASVLFFSFSFYTFIKIQRHFVIKVVLFDYYYLKVV